jgi:hypothetical protein
MSSSRSSTVRVAALVGLAVLLPASSRADRDRPPRWFADRPVAWDEHDDGDVPRAPAPNELQEWRMTLLLRDSLAAEADRILALEGVRPAQDVNAADEVPCSTWFCPRNHLRPMSAAEVAAGPPASPPRLPLRIVKGKDQGATTGFQVVDAGGVRFMLKVDPAGHVGMSTGAEVVGGRFFHAAGYNVPGAFVLDLGPEHLNVDGAATFQLYRVQRRPLTAERVQAMLAKVARTPDGKLRVVLVPWVPGKLLGGFDMLGRRKDDPNDRIPHELRRSLRASWVLMAWLGVLDPSSINTIDSYVEQDGRRFVRHYIFDFGAALGSSTVDVKGPYQTGEHVLEVGRTLGAFFAFGLYRRPFQLDRGEWEALVERYPSAGWFPAEGFDPDAYRSNRKVPSHVRRTERDMYWGAKLVTSFSNEQIAAVVAAARFPEPDARYLTHALAVRRDVIGRRYLRATTAVEDPVATVDSTGVCFRDLAIERGYAHAEEVRYQVEVDDGAGNRLRSDEHRARGPRSCVPIAFGAQGTGYRIVEVTTTFSANTKGAAALAPSRAARIHLRWRQKEQRFVVVGLERDE